MYSEIKYSLNAIWLVPPLLFLGLRWNPVTRAPLALHLFTTRALIIRHFYTVEIFPEDV